MFTIWSNRSEVHNWDPDKARDTEKRGERNQKTKKGDRKEEWRSAGSVGNSEGGWSRGARRPKAGK